MNRLELVERIRTHNSYLCVGLDPDLSRMPAFLQNSEDPIFTFNKAIIDATHEFCVAYKPNLAFYEAHGTYGWEALERTLDYIPHTHLTIADAKRGDIGNTSRLYAKAFFEHLEVDAITVAPYMGRDSVEPFLGFDNKWVIVLGLTSNKGSADFQQQSLSNGKAVYQEVLAQVASWGSKDELMFVVGATHPEHLQEIRQIIPDHFLLVPGVGAQGGDLAQVAAHGMNQDVGLLVNSSRGIIYAGNGMDFADQAREAARALQRQMAATLKG
jgi:orotidine-5'-phosphate decarboxylase